MRHTGLRPRCLVLVGLLVVVMPPLWFRGERLPTGSNQQVGAVPMTAHRDPATGRLAAAPSNLGAGDADRITGGAAQRPRPLKMPERAVGARPGGFRIDLDARFAQGMTASRAADGSLRTDCGPTESPKAESEGHKE